MVHGIIKIKKFVFLVMFIVMVTVTLAAQQFGALTLNANSVSWNNSFVGAQEQAKREGKVMLLFFEGKQQNAITASLLYNTFSESTVYNYINNNFVAVRVKGSEELRSRFNVIRYPTVVLFDVQTDKIVGQISGIMSTENVIALLSKSPKRNFNEDIGANRGTNVTTTGRVTYEGGAFLYLGEDKWLHKTPFYAIEYRAFNEDSGYYFLANEKRDVLIAIPKSKNRNTSSIWIWKDDNWRSIGQAEVVEEIAGGSLPSSSSSADAGVNSFYSLPNTTNDNDVAAQQDQSFGNQNDIQQNSGFGNDSVQNSSGNSLGSNDQF